MDISNMENWKIIPDMERYIINRSGEVRNRFTQKVIFPRKDKNLIHLTISRDKRVTRSPAKLVREIFGDVASA